MRHVGWLLTLCVLVALPGSAQEESFSPDLTVMFNLKEDGATLSPQNKLPDEVEAHSTGRAEYDTIPGDPVRYNREATKVGEWIADEVAYDQAITIEQANLWWKGKDPDYAADCEWTFYFRVNDEDVEDDVVTCTSNGDDLAEETWSLSWSYGLIAGDTFGFEIWYEGWEDADIYHDNVTYDTGFFVTSKPLSFFGASISGESVTVEFTEAWPVDWKTNLKGGYVMLMGMDGYMGDNDQASVSEGAEHEMSNGTIATGTVITWNGVVGNELKIMLHYTQFDHMGGGGNGTNGTTNDPLVTLTIVTTATISDDGGLLGLPGFPLLLAVPALAFAARRRR